MNDNMRRTFNDSPRYMIEQKRWAKEIMTESMHTGIYSCRYETDYDHEWIDRLPWNCGHGPLGITSDYGDDWMIVHCHSHLAFFVCGWWIPREPGLCQV
jgi:hypothetical protein